MRILTFFAAALIVGVVTGIPVQAKTVDRGAACEDLSIDLTEQSSGEYAVLINSAVSKNIDPSERFQPSDVDVYGFMQLGEWSAAMGSIPIADDGLFLFESVDGKKQYRGVWGGMIEATDALELEKWAESSGAPKDTAKCFAQQMTVIDAVSPDSFTVELLSSANLQARLTQLGEEIMVSASYYANPSPEGEKHINDVGLVDLGNEHLLVPVDIGVVEVPGDGIDEDKLDWIDGDIWTSVSVFSARLTSDLNLIRCDFINAPIESLIESMPVVIHCGLIEEGIETEVKP